MNQFGSGKLHMRKLLLGGILSGLGALSMFAATTPLYINNSPFLSPPALPPQIDAEAFVTGGNIDPFEMMNTRFVTNAPGAIMRGSPGFRFDYFSAANNARLAQT